MINPAKIAARIFKDLTWHFTGKDNQIFLTFDDGPNPEITPWVLDLLDKYNAKATFFCLGENVVKYPQLYHAIISAGHSVGNHTFNHNKGFQVSDQAYLDSVEKAAQQINSKIFRPPYGSIKPSQVKILKKEYKIVMWDVLSKDYDLSVSPEKVYERVIKYAQSGSIVVFHDKKKAEKSLKYALPRVLDYYTKKGYSFQAIDCQAN